MTENTKIEWADHTFNPWVGCTAISPACDFCYARTWAKRTGHPELWEGERRRTSEANWREPLKWNRNHEAFFAAHGRRQRVFCASLADVFDNQVDLAWLIDLWALIKATPHLDWMLLTKRPQNIPGRLLGDWGLGYPNVWLGTTVENQDQACRRIPALLTVNARVRFLSCEPLLGPLTVEKIVPHGAPMGFMYPLDSARRIHLVIAGGESGGKCRPMHPDWARALRDQCQATGTAFFFKQWGDKAPVYDRDLEDPDWRMCRPIEIKTPDGQWLNLAGGMGFHGERVVRMDHIGKKRAGRQLDGRTWDEMPKGVAA